MCAPNTNKHKQTQITHIRVWFVFLPPTHARLQTPATNTYAFATFSEQTQLRLLVYTPNTYALVPKHDYYMGFSQHIFLLVQSDPGPSFMVLFAQHACLVGFALQTHVRLTIRNKFVFLSPCPSHTELLNFLHGCGLVYRRPSRKATASSALLCYAEAKKPFQYHQKPSNLYLKLLNIRKTT